MSTGLSSECTVSAPYGRGRDGGSGTVLVLGVIAVALMLFGGAAALAAAQHARGTAQGAADLGAIGGAEAIRDGDDGCSVAGAVVVRNGGVLVSCAEGSRGVVTVEVEVRATIGAVRIGDAEASARAGPAACRQRGACTSTASSSATAPSLSSGSLKLPHLGD